MKWRYPLDKDRRTRKVFAWWPIGFEGHYYWFETVELVEVYVSYPDWWCIESLKQMKSRGDEQ